MPPKKEPKKQRIRLTNKFLESQKFSTMKLPQRSEIVGNHGDIEALQQDHNTARNNSNSESGDASRRSETGFAFDPIPNDNTFVIVKESKYWPPPTLEELQKATGIQVSGTDGFDAYDRREDDLKAAKEYTKKKVVKGELNHPRGKPRQNVIQKISDDSSSDEK